MRVSYDQMVSLASDILDTVSRRAISWGFSVVELWTKGKEGTIKPFATGDLGQKDTPILREPAALSEADYVLVESTYGTTVRGKPNFTEFGNDIWKALDCGGSVQIAAFTLKTTQKVLYVLGHLKREGTIRIERSRSW